MKEKMDHIHTDIQRYTRKVNTRSSLSLFVSRSPSISLSVSLPLHLPLCLSLPLCVSPSLSLSLSVCLCKWIRHSGCGPPTVYSPYAACMGPVCERRQGLPQEHPPL